MCVCVGVVSLLPKNVHSRYVELVVGDTSNIHFNMIPNSLRISIDGISTIPILDNAYVHNTHA